MIKKSNKILVIIGFVAVILGFANFLVSNGGLNRILSVSQQGMTNQEAISIEASPLSETSPSPIIIEEKDFIPSYSFEATTSGQTAFKLLINSIDEVKYTEYDFGTFIESINGIAGDNENFWAFYLNGEKAQTGVDKTILKAGDTVQLIYEKIEF